MNLFCDLYNDLSKEILFLTEKYINIYIPAIPADTPDIFEHDVKSYCILSHACFEEYIENVSQNLMTVIKQQYLDRKISLSTAILIMTYSKN